MAESRNLVVLRAGDGSLHPGWLAADPARNWDLHISYYGKQDEPFGVLPAGVSLSLESGPKYLGLADCLDRHPHLLADYDYVAFPDDDLQACTGTWSEAFAIMRKSGAALGQCTLDPRSFVSHAITIRRPSLLYREVNWVEVMMPIFATDALRDVRALFRANETSWGLDYLLSDAVLKRGGKIAMIDAVSFFHTRRVGKGNNYKAGGPTPRQDRDQTLRAHGVRLFAQRTLRSITPDGAVQSGSVDWCGPLLRSLFHEARKNLRRIDRLDL